MRFAHLKLRNWRNFTEVDVPLADRVFLVGPNASGKSNLLDVFRFLRTLASSGLQEAVESRGGLSKIRSLFARRHPHVEVEMVLVEDGEVEWTYRLVMHQEARGRRRPLVAAEEVRKNGVTLFSRPDANDQADNELLTQTHLEQTSLNKTFRDISTVFQRTSYLHLVPQLLKHPEISKRNGHADDPFGQRFMDRIMEAPESVRRSRLRKIESALRVAVPEFKNLVDKRDEITGAPHLEAIYEHWRPHGARQREDQFSDGTLRLIGLLWVLLESSTLLLLEEPELSLHNEIVRKLPALMWGIQRQAKVKRQIFVSTHSYELLSDKGIQPEQVILVQPSRGEGSTVQLAAHLEQVRQLMDNGLSAADAVLPKTQPVAMHPLLNFE